MNNNVLEEISEVLIAKGFSGGVINAIQILLNETMKIERQAYLNASPYERTEDRVSQGNGYKNKTLTTRVGKIELDVPQTRDGNFYPASIEKGIRSERALKIALAEMYIQGVSTNKVKKVTEALCGFEVSSMQVSNATKLLDEELEKWRERPLGQYVYLIPDARYEKVRYGGVVQDLAVIWAIGITPDGKREVLGVSVSLSEAEVHWREFFTSLVKRGLHGVEYIVSDDHLGLKAARKAVFPGAIWNRCHFHLAQNAQNHVSKKSNKELVARDIRTILEAPTLEMAQQALAQFVDKYQEEEPKLAKWAEENIPEGFNAYKVGPDNYKKLRTSNMIERFNREINRRTKVVGIFPNDASCLRLVTAVLVEIHDTWLTQKSYFKF